MANLRKRTVGVASTLNLRVLVSGDNEYVTLKGPRAGAIADLLDPGGNYHWLETACVHYSEEMDRRIVELVDVLGELRRATGHMQLELGLGVGADG